MPRTRSLTITLPDDMADLVRAKVASGEFGNEVDVVAEGLRTLVEKDLETERWLRDDVAPVYDAYKADPAVARSLDDAFADLDAFMAKTEGLAR
ncbi:Arc/MetJ-type ribon-helix-helix transcriptional regulator [Peteryoungia aggregata LMG 23059]|uniref:Arc/MetJ-type ribon-helix-helix transcriptional regulator n=1 Tax=Peteryoungia aggregata LMG 23059 TaxID=1368425 RepID=A0ABU0GBL4_9HYPH|nr:type II toxin-antitoxin system ParD family antitoxin [Peteryoungia aggregata]MDQ0422020.1 Arc/MetJ-type ribon-helix-helix transcriptional regulator [Peteryoungia aggregata LMG 23059]